MFVREGDLVDAKTVLVEFGIGLEVINQKFEFLR